MSPVHWRACSHSFLGRVFFMRTIVFIDGQNLYHLAKHAWAPRGGKMWHKYSWPSYDVLRLANRLVGMRPGHVLAETRFYTGVPNPHHGDQQRRWYEFWANKIRTLRSQGVCVYRGTVNRWGQEKGVDVSLAIDLIQATYEERFDAAIIVSQDSDFGPAVRLSKLISEEQGRLRSFESIFPWPQAIRKRPRGIPGTRWSPLNKAVYDSCYDPTDYRTI